MSLFYQDFGDGEPVVLVHGRPLSHRFWDATDASPKATAGSLTAWSAAHPDADLSHVTVPTLIVQGERDAFVPLEGSGARIARAIANSVLVTIPDAPHGAPLTHDGQRNQLMLEFLAR
ncbi:alpha/beta fold hydrolase [Streptosporangium sp. 'caverna']|uniref:alpha/beta fold hydrolase n=1 Tax=Streptosporangium sp. 'caverna' TaxID=2202249 RepID=UPI0013A68949|nr:alpha/beta hydrolase [Streptosporangium sp. 'caverna']